MQHPTPWVVEDTDDVAAFVCVHQRRVPEVTQSTVLAYFVEMVAMQVDAMWERCVIGECDADRLTSLK